jgi:hypothetical protein
MILHLVGSRFYNAHREDSDFDYIGENTPEMRRFCLSLGLRRLDQSKHERYWGHGIDVCLVPNLEISLKARDALLKIPNIDKMSKADRHDKLMEVMRALRLGRAIQI